MRKFVAALITSIIALSVSDIANAGDSDRFMASAMWNACKTPFATTYRRLKKPKAMVAGFNKRNKKGYCYWERNHTHAAFASIHLDNSCERQGYVCLTIALDNQLVGWGRKVVQLHKEYGQLLATNAARTRLAEQRRRQQQRQSSGGGQWTADDQAVLNGVLGILGGVAQGAYNNNVNRSRAKVPTYSPPPAAAPSYNSGGCLPEQIARGWSEERCAHN